MNRFLIPLILALFWAPAGARDEVPQIAVDDLLQEVSGIEEEARKGFDSAHDLQPGAERNEILFKARKLLKQAIEKYRLAGQVAPDRVKEFSEKATDLQGMLFWCNKSVAVLVEPARLPESPSLSPKSENPTVLPPGSPSLLPEQERDEIAVLLESARAGHQRIEDLSDQVFAFESNRKDVLALLKRSRKEWEKSHGDVFEAYRGKSVKSAGISLAAAQAYEERRDRLLDNVCNLSNRARSASTEARKLQSEVRTCLERVEAYGTRAFPYMADWCDQHQTPPLPEAFLRYLNGQFRIPQFRFTPVPSSDQFPQEAALPPAKVQEVVKLLDALAKDACREADLSFQVADANAEREQILDELEDLELHREWCKWFSAPSKALSGKSQRAEEALKATLAKVDGHKKRFGEEKGALRKQLDGRRSCLNGLDPSLVRIVEAWRRKQVLLPESLSSDLESWTRTAVVSARKIEDVSTP